MDLLRTHVNKILVSCVLVEATYVEVGFRQLLRLLALHRVIAKVSTHRPALTTCGTARTTVCVRRRRGGRNSLSSILKNRIVGIFIIQVRHRNRMNNNQG